MKMNLRKILLCSMLGLFLSVGVPSIIDSVEAHGGHSDWRGREHHRREHHQREHRRHRNKHRRERQRIYRGGQYIYIQPPVVYTPARRCVNRQVQWCHPHYRWERRCY